MLAGWAAAQDGGSANYQCLPPQNCWPPPCGLLPCDACKQAKSLCPDKDDFFLLPPRLCWYGVADGAAIRRDPKGDFNFASLSTPGNIVLSTRNFDYDFRAAGHFLVGHEISDCFQIEGEYTGVTEAEDSAAVRDPRGNLFSPFSGFGASPINGLDHNNLAQIRYLSSLQMVELNIRRQVPMPPDRLAVSVLFGVRYITLPEKFAYLTQTTTPTPTTVTIDVATDNQMIGPQIGALFEMYIDNRWWMNFEIKGAVLNNRARQSTTYSNSADGTFSAGQREDHTAFAGDLALTFIYRWSPHFTTRLGYQALFLQDVALAPDNFNTDINIVTQGPARLNHNAGTVYHGPHAGLMFGW
jgi:hypothetical protein